MSQPPYASAPPPGTYGPPPGDGGRRTALVAGILIGAIVVVGGIVGAVLLVGGRDDDDVAAVSPEATAQTFVDALNAVDCDTIDNLRTEHLIDRDGACDPEAFDDAVEYGAPDVVEESDAAASVQLATSSAGGPGLVILEMVSEAETWMVDDMSVRTFGTGTPTSTPTTTSEPPASDPPPGTSTGSPQETADAFAAAVRGQDCAAVDALTTDSFRASFDCEVDLRMPAGVAWELGDPEVVSQGGDSAWARVVMVIEGTEVPITSHLVNVDGAWLVDSLDLSEFPDLSHQ